MNLLPKSSSEFTHLDYWNQFFKKRGQKAFEWYGEYPELCGILHKYIRPRDRILVIGCGNSGLSSDLYNVGYKQIMNIDMSSVVIKQMQIRCRDKPGLEYKVMDATAMSFADGAFSVVLDKGTLDAMMPDSAPETVERIEKLYSEIDRVLSPLGRFVCVSLLQPHILRSLAGMCSARGWMLRVCRCHEAEHSSEDGGTSLPVFVVVCTKLKKMPNAKLVIEFCHSGETANRVSCVEHLLSTVKSLQDLALVCGGLRRCSVAGSGEVIEFCHSGETANCVSCVEHLLSTVKSLQDLALVCGGLRRCSVAGSGEVIEFCHSGETANCVSCVEHLLSTVKSLQDLALVCGGLRRCSVAGSGEVIEFCHSGETANRVSCVEHLLSTVKSLQDLALVCGGLRRCSVAGSGEVIEFCHSGETANRVSCVEHLLSTVKSLQDLALVCGGLRRCSVAGSGEVIEFCHSGETANRVSCVEHLLSTVKSLQDLALVCGGLRRCSVAGSGEVSVELIQPNEPELKPRYTITVTDSPRALNINRMRFAAFVVPQGREREWIFGSAEGRLSLLMSTGYDRLAVIRLHRGQLYDSLAAVQNETADIIMKLAPRYKGPGPEPTIPYLSVGSDLGQVIEVARGESDLSGEYVVEDVEGDNKRMWRRLVFLSNQGVVQSEARLKSVEENGSARQVVDGSHLACEHHVYMTLGVSLVAAGDKPCDVLVVGLGGGALPTYIRNCLKTVKITAVDIDPVIREIATTHFQLKEDGNMNVVIEDGLNYLKNAANKGVKFGAILFDVDNKDASVGLSFPPVSFLESTTLSDVSQALDDSGVFVLNFVCRVEEIREQTCTKLRSLFKDLSSVKLKEEVNEVFFCFKNKPLVTVEEAVDKLNSAVKKHKLQESDLIDKQELKSMLRINL